MGETAIIAFNNFELILLLIGLTVSSTIYELVLSPMAMSFVTLLIIFKIAMFVIESAELKMANSDLINGQFYLKMLFFICIARLLLRKTDLKIKTVKSINNQEELDRNVKVNTFVPKDTEYSLEGTGLFSLSKTGDEMFGDTWFSIDQPHSEILEGTPIIDSKYNDGGVYSVKLPIFVIFPIVLVDTLLYGSDGTLNGESKGIIPTIFGKYYAYLVHNPGRIFHLVYDNAKMSVERQSGKMYGGYTDYRTSMMDTIHFINKSAEDIVQIYNNLPLYIYLDVRTGEKDSAKKDWRYNETSTQMVEIFKILNEYNKKLAVTSKTILNDNGRYLIPFTNFVNNHSGSSKSIPPVYPNKDFDISDNKAEDRYPTWKSTSPGDLISSEYYMAGKMTILQIDVPLNPVSDEEKFISELRNAYTSITKQNIPLNKRDNPYEDVILNPGFYKQTEVNGLGFGGNYYSDYTLMFNLYENYASNLDGGRAPLVEKNPFDLLINDFKSIEKNIYNKDSNQILEIPSFASEAIKKQKIEAEKYNPMGNTTEKSTKAKKQYLEYQKDAYFKYYFIEPINFNGGQYYRNLESSYANKAPSIYHLWKRYQNFYNSIANAMLPKNTSIENIEIYKKLIRPVSSNGGAMNPEKPRKYIMKVQEQVAVKNDSVIEEFRNKYYKNTRDTAEKMINLKINNLWATNTKNIGQDEIATDNTEFTSDYDKNEVSLELPIIGNIGTSIVNFLLGVLGFILKFALQGVFWVLTHLFRILYSFIYSLHSLGILITLVTFPLIFIKAMMSQSFTGLIKPFLNYLTYRMWDFALLLIIMIVLMVTPVLLKFFFAFPEFIAIILEILYIVGIFVLTSTIIDMVTKLVGGESSFSGMFGSVGSGLAKTTATRGIRGAATASGAAALAGGRLASGVASKYELGSRLSNVVGSGTQKLGNLTGVGNSNGGKKIARFGKKISENEKFQKFKSSSASLASGIGDTASKAKNLMGSSLRDYSRFQNEGGVAKAIFSGGDNFRQFDNSEEKTVGKGFKKFIRGDEFEGGSSKTKTAEELTVGENKNNNSTNSSNNVNSNSSNKEEGNDFVSGRPRLDGVDNGVGNSNGGKKIDGRNVNPSGNDFVSGSQSKKIDGHNVNPKVEVSDINVGNVNTSNLKADSFASQINKALNSDKQDKKEPVNNITKAFGDIGKRAKSDAAKVVNEITKTPVRDGSSNGGNGMKQNENSQVTKKPSEKVVELVKKEVTEMVKKEQRNSGVSSKANLDESIDKLSKRLSAVMTNNNMENKTSSQVKNMFNSSSEVQAILKASPELNNIVDNFSKSVSTK